MNAEAGDFFEQAIANRNLVPLLPGERYDWQITILFYECVHYLNVVFRICKTATPSKHTERFRALNSMAVFVPIRKTYENLYDLSIISRYEAYKIKDLQKDVVSATEYTRKIRDFCRPIARTEGFIIP